MAMTNPTTPSAAAAAAAAAASGGATGSPSNNGASSPSLFARSAAKLHGPLSAPSLSFSSDVASEASGGPRPPLAGLSAARLAALSAAPTPKNGNLTKPSLAQLRARKIMSEARRARTHRAKAGPASPASAGDDDNTDVSSIVDLDTVAHAGSFVESLQKLSLDEGKEDAEAAAAPRLKVETTGRYQSSLANARKAALTSPVAASSRKKKGGPKEGAGEPKPCTNGITDEPKKGKAAQPAAAVSEGDSGDDAKKDAHYYAILAQIQAAAQDDNSLGMGKILTDARKRGLSLVTVTRMIKEERAKAQQDKQNLAMADALKKGEGEKDVGDVGDVEALPDVGTPTESKLSAVLKYREAARSSKKSTATTPQDVADGAITATGAREILGLVKERVESKLKVAATKEAAATATRPKAAADSRKTEAQRNTVVVKDQGEVEKLEAATDPQAGIAQGMSELSRLCDQATVLVGKPSSADSSPKSGATTEGGPTVSTKSKKEEKAPAEAKMASKKTGPKRSKAEEDPQKGGKADRGKSKEPKLAVLQHLMEKAEDSLGTTGKKTKKKKTPAKLKKTGSKTKEIQQHEPKAAPGVLNELQLLQLQNMAVEAEKLIEAERLAEDAIMQSLGHAGSGGAETTVDQAGSVEDIDAFFAKFSIQNEGGTAGEISEPEAVAQSTLGSEQTGDVNEEGCTEASDRECSDDFFDDNKSEEAKLDEACDSMDEELVWDVESRGVPTADENRNTNLPNHLGQWKSPWHNDDDARKKQQCLSADKRLAGHPGYMNIDFYSLMDATIVKAEEEDIDKAPWEYRDVGQRFLHEKSLESRNWFGTFELERGNDRVPNPVCRPKALEISVTRIAEPGEWSDDWYTSWKTRRDNPNNLLAYAQDETAKVKENLPRIASTSSPTVKKVVEIGSLCPVRPRTGERVSRVHPDFTSSLRQSRWRKKYLKGSMFRLD